MKLTLDFDDGSISTLDNTHLNLKRALHGEERMDIGWIGINWKSFDIIPICPNPKLEKGSPIKLSDQQMEIIRFLNPTSGGWTADSKMAWLTSNQDSNDMFLAVDDLGNWRIPSPGICGGSIVRVLWEDGIMSAIQCYDMKNPLPVAFEDYMKFEWYGIGVRGFEKEPYHYRVRDGVVTPIMFSNPFGYVPTTWLVNV